MSMLSLRAQVTVCARDMTWITSPLSTGSSKESIVQALGKLRLLLSSAAHSLVPLDASNDPATALYPTANTRNTATGLHLPAPQQ